MVETGSKIYPRYLPGAALLVNREELEMSKTNKAGAWLSIMWKGVMSVINAKGKIKVERKRKRFKKV